MNTNEFVSEYWHQEDKARRVEIASWLSYTNSVLERFWCLIYFTWQKHKNSRLLSTSPYLIVGVFAEDARARGGGFLGDILLFDPAKEELLTVRDKTVSE